MAVGSFKNGVPNHMLNGSSEVSLGTDKKSLCVRHYTFSCGLYENPYIFSHFYIHLQFLNTAQYKHCGSAHTFQFLSSLFVEFKAKKQGVGRKNHKLFYQK